MKALSIKQPWASLIAHGIKDKENRTWKTNFRGRIYIHSSAVHLYYKELSLVRLEELKINHPKILKKLLDKSLTTSAIIGEVDIIDCVVNHPSIWADKNGFDFTAFEINENYYND